MRLLIVDNDAAVRATYAAVIKDMGHVRKELRQAAGHDVIQSVPNGFVLNIGSQRLQ